MSAAPHTERPEPSQPEGGKGSGAADSLLEAAREHLGNIRDALPPDHPATKKRQRVVDVLETMQQEIGPDQDPMDYLTKKDLSTAARTESGGLVGMGSPEIVATRRFIEQQRAASAETSTQAPERKPLYSDADIEASRRKIAAMHVGSERLAGQETERVESGLDREREKLLIGEVLDKGGVSLHLDLPGEYGDRRGTHGFQDATDGNRHGEGFEDRRVLSEMTKRAAEDGANEAVSFTPVTETVWEQSEVSERKGLRKKTHTERRAVGTKPATHDAVVKGGDGEPAVALRYAAHDLPGEMSYQVTDGRYGGLLQAEIVLPESLARKVEKHMERDPGFIRRIIQEAATKKLGLPEAAWTHGNETTRDHALQPPYQKWAAEKGGTSKMRVTSLDQSNTVVRV